MVESGWLVRGGGGAVSDSQTGALPSLHLFFPGPGGQLSRNGSAQPASTREGAVVRPSKPSRALETKGDGVSASARIPGLSKAGREADP